MIKRLIRILLGPSKQKKIRLLRSYLYDFRRYLKHSSYMNVDNQNKLIAIIIAHYHVLEKGLAMPKPRAKFGENIAQQLVTHLDSYVGSGYDTEHRQFLTALLVLKDYVKFLKANKIRYDFLETSLFDFLSGSGRNSVEEIGKEDFLEFQNSRFLDFALSRKTVRNWTNQEVDIEILKNAVKIAQQSPSVCNRQSTRVHIVNSKKRIKEILENQNGNRGFGHLASNLLLISYDINMFFDPSERNQGYIDCGMFAMSLLYALHYYGLGVCTLNWAIEFNQDQRMRKSINLGENETIAMILLVGHLKESFKVTKSERQKFDDIATINVL